MYNNAFYQDSDKESTEQKMLFSDTMLQAEKYMLLLSICRMTVIF